MVTTIAAPVALGFETLLRKLLFPLLMDDDFDVVRTFLRPALTPFAWLLCGIALLAMLAGFALHARLVARAIGRLPPQRRELPRERARAELGAFLLSASVPQLPCVLSTVMFTFGAEFLPVLLTVTIGSLGVLGQALRTRTS